MSRWLEMVRERLICVTKDTASTALHLQGEHAVASAPENLSKVACDAGSSSISIRPNQRHVFLAASDSLNLTVLGKSIVTSNGGVWANRNPICVRSRHSNCTHPQSLLQKLCWQEVGKNGVRVLMKSARWRVRYKITFI